jgi:hypothetical protein
MEAADDVSLLLHMRSSSPLTCREDAMYYNQSTQTRTFKVVEKSNFSDDDLKWIGALLNVTLVTLQKKSIRVRTDTEDAIAGIIDAINKKYCNSSKPKLSPLF